MNSWIYVLFAAIVEVFWVLGLKFSDTALEWAGTVLAIIISFYCIIKACEKLPSGTVYAVFYWFRCSSNCPDRFYIAGIRIFIRHRALYRSYYHRGCGHPADNNRTTNRREGAVDGVVLFDIGQFW